MSVRGVSIPYWARIIMVIFLDIWLLWSHHGVVFDTIANKFEIPNPFSYKINTWGRQWPCKYRHKQLQKVHADNPALAYYVATNYISLGEFTSCVGVCQIGRLGVWSSILVSNFIYLTTDKFRKNKKQLKIIKIFGWILIGMNMGLSLIMNWPLFIRSIPAYVILILLQLDLYSYDSDAPENIPSTTTPLPTTTK